MGAFLKPTESVPSTVKLLRVPEVGVPRTGVTSEGEVAKTREPVPVSSVTAAAKFAEDGVPRNVATPEPNEVMPVPPLATGRVPVTLVAKLTSVMVFVLPLMVLLVRVSVVALATTVSVEVGSVNVPVLLICAITGVVKVLLVSV